MTLNMFLALLGRFMLKLVGYYFATLVVLAILFPGIDKFQIIFFSWFAAALVVILTQKKLVHQ